MIPVLKLICNNCGREFDVNPGHYAELGLRALPRRCPTCCDQEQKRPSIVVERQLLNVYDAVEIVSLPGDWEQIQGAEGDIPSYKINIKGGQFGADWHGRIDLFAPKPFQAGEVVSIREMEAQHKVKIIRLTTDDPEAQETILTHKYLVFETYTGEAKYRLMWATAHTKTTLKGFGRQYWTKIAGAPIAKWEVSGGYRSGRAHTTGVLAIVDAEHPLYVVTKGDIKNEKIYS